MQVNNDRFELPETLYNPQCNGVVTSDKATTGTYNTRKRIFVRENINIVQESSE